MMSQTDHVAVSGEGATLTAGDSSRSSHDPASGRMRLRLTDLLLPAGIALWAIGVSTTDATALGSYGLPPVLPSMFWAGVVLILVSAAVELGRDHVSGWRMALHTMTLTVMLYGTAALVYSQGRYSWLYKTIGVVQYVNANGQLNRTIDIYQNWPGFFAFAAWFGKVAGVASPLAYAKWAQLVFELAALPLLYLAYDALSLTPRQCWLALLLYTGTNWIGQDYFSPQGLGTVLSLGIMAIALRWLYVRKSPTSPGVQTGKDRAGKSSPRGRYPVLLGVALLIIYFVLSFEHELSPYILAVQIGALAVARLVRPRWLPVLLFAIALGYLAPRFGYVNSTYGLLNSIGNFFSNARPPALQGGSVSAAQHTILRSQEALSLGMWFLAVVGVLLRRRGGRSVLTLALLAFSPFITLAMLAYGQEGVLRVYLFSLPWTAALAALALAPFPIVSKLKAYGTSKSAQALATSLWVPRNGSSAADDTVIFDRRTVNGAMQATALAREAAAAATGQASPGGAPAGHKLPPAASASGPNGPVGADDTAIGSRTDADGTRQAAVLARPAADTRPDQAGLDQAGIDQAGASGVASPAGRPAVAQPADSDRRSRLTRQRRQIMILLSLAAMVFIAAIIAAVAVGG
jgi:hypothetical protein